MSARRKKTAAKRAPAKTNDFAKLRIKWIDALDRQLHAHPGAPPGSDLAWSVTKLVKQLRDYREGFVAALNLSKAKK
jgi:hypothetical protein